MKLFHREGAARPPFVRWALEEAGAPYEWVVLSREECGSPAHLDRQPLGRVPALEDDEGSLFESAALCLHIADRYPERRLIGSLGSRERALAYQWTQFAMTDLEPPIAESAITRADDPARSASALERADRAIAVLDAAVDRHDHLVGDRFTVADIVVGGVLTIAVQRGAVRPPQGVGDYLGRLASRPAHRRVYA
jgi:glutathione S-transferase